MQLRRLSLGRPILEIIQWILTDGNGKTQCQSKKVLESDLHGVDKQVKKRGSTSPELRSWDPGPTSRVLSGSAFKDTASCLCFENTILLFNEASCPENSSKHAKSMKSRLTNCDPCVPHKVRSMQQWSRLMDSSKWQTNRNEDLIRHSRRFRVFFFLQTRCEQDCGSLPNSISTYWNRIVPLTVKPSLITLFPWRM